MRTAVRIADKILDTCVLLVCLLMLLMCIYAGYDTYMVYYHASDSSILKYKPKGGDTDAMNREFPDAAAWLVIDGTAIDYPVMQGEDNDTYLNADPYGKYSLSGSIFLDYRNAADFSDPYSLIYGHHMERDMMFGCLDRYYDRSFFDGHRTGTLTVSDGTVYHITLFAVLDTDTNSVVYNTETDRGQLLEYVRDSAAIYEEPGSGNVIGMSTCIGDANSTERLAVFGELIS